MSKITKIPSTSHNFSLKKSSDTRTVLASVFFTEVACFAHSLFYSTTRDEVCEEKLPSCPQNIIASPPFIGTAIPWQRRRDILPKKSSHLKMPQTRCDLCTCLTGKPKAPKASIFRNTLPPHTVEHFSSILVPCKVTWRTGWHTSQDAHLQMCEGTLNGGLSSKNIHFFTRTFTQALHFSTRTSA